jgi:ketosteroid isomerase-like protein
LDLGLHRERLSRDIAILAAMGSDVREVIRAGLDAWSRGDLEGTLEVFDPEFEFVTSGIFPGLEPVYRGHDGFRRFWADFRGPWQGIAIEVDRIVAGRPPLLAVIGSFSATGRDGITVEAPVGLLFTTAADLITGIQGFGSADEALAAAGLPPGGG